MSSTAYQNSTIIINTNVGNVWDSYNNAVSDERRQILEWLSPLAPRERHRAVSEGRMDGVETGFSERTSLRNGIEGRIRLSILCYFVTVIPGWVRHI